MEVMQVKTSYFLGKAPQHILPNDLLDYFLYAFEFAWTASCFDPYREHIHDHFESNLEALKEKHPQLTKEQEWWALILIALKDFAVEREFSYATETIDLLFKNYSNLTELELERYANEINTGIYDETMDSLSLRPLTLEILESDAMKSDKMLRYFLKYKDDFVKSFNKHLNQKDIDMNYLGQLLPNDKKIRLKFSSFWDVYYEVYVGYSLSVLQYSMRNTHGKKINIDELIRKTNLVFLIASVKPKEKIEALTNELGLIVKEYFNLK